MAEDAAQERAKKVVLRGTSSPIEIYIIVLS
jgi:hypothetical protein